MPSKLLDMFLALTEALEHRRFQPGQVQFSKSAWNDPHIQKTLQHVSSVLHRTPQSVVDEIEKEMAQFKSMEQKAPLLYATMNANAIEDRLFSLMWKTPGSEVQGAPQFSERVFMKLQRMIAAEHTEFWPLRSYIDGRALQPHWEIVPVGHEIDTAAATPQGKFYFNHGFMQKLLDYAHLKGIHPKGQKYAANGGDIPDGYAYIEFLIMHELMHYSNDDFYYQKVIPNANPTIINWVGDFRSNYLLVKSGYEQLPMGLYNDGINYDRQPTYRQMYDLVAAEMKKLSPEEEEKVKQRADELADDHEPGTKEGARSDVSEKDMSEEDIDKAGKATAGKVEEGEDMTPGEASQKNKGPSGPGGGADHEKQEQSKGGDADVDWSKIKPSFDWKALVKRFLSTAKPKMEDTYTKPARRAVAQLDVARQTGSAAVKPGERVSGTVDSKLAFCFDASGSMYSVIPKVFANASALLSTPAFKNSESVIMRFSSSFIIYKAIFAKKVAARVKSVKDKVKSWDEPITAALNMGEFGGTTFGAPLATQCMAALSDKWNIIFFLDSDILSGPNLTYFKSVVQHAPSQVFVVFDSRTTYLEFRQRTGFTTPNITYFA